MSYESTVKDWAATIRTGVVETVKELTQNVQISIVISTPIDTGRARTSWNINPGEAADLSVTPLLASTRNTVTGALIALAPPGASPLTRSQALTVAMGRWQAIEALTEPVATVSNNLDYIYSLERGASPQADAGYMFARNVLLAFEEAELLGFKARLT